MDVDAIPGTEHERHLAFLAFVGVLGGGFIASEAVRSIREGSLFKMDAVKAKPTLGIMSLGGGIVFLGVAMNEMAKEYGWKTLIWTNVGVTALVVAGRAIRR